MCSISYLSSIDGRKWKGGWNPFNKIPRPLIPAHPGRANLHCRSGSPHMRSSVRIPRASLQLNWGSRMKPPKPLITCKNVPRIRGVDAGKACKTWGVRRTFGVRRNDEGCSTTQHMGVFPSYHPLMQDIDISLATFLAIPASCITCTTSCTFL